MGRGTHPVVMFDLIPHPMLHTPVPANLEAGAALSAKLGNVGQGIVFGDLSAGGILGLLVEGEVQNRLRDRLQVVELFFGVAVALEEEEALLAHAARGGTRSVSQPSCSVQGSHAAESTAGTADEMTHAFSKSAASAWREASPSGPST